jgi:hypothetical protein
VSHQIYPYDIVASEILKLIFPGFNTAAKAMDEKNPFVRIVVYLFVIQHICPLKTETMNKCIRLLSGRNGYVRKMIAGQAFVVKEELPYFVYFSMYPLVRGWTFFQCPRAAAGLSGKTL